MSPVLPIRSISMTGSVARFAVSARSLSTNCLRERSSFNSHATLVAAHAGTQPLMVWSVSCHPMANWPPLP